MVRVMQIVCIFHLEKPFSGANSLCDRLNIEAGETSQDRVGHFLCESHFDSKNLIQTLFILF